MAPRLQQVPPKPNWGSSNPPISELRQGVVIYCVAVYEPSRASRRMEEALLAGLPIANCQFGIRYSLQLASAETFLSPIGPVSHCPTATLSVKCNPRNLPQPPCPPGAPGCSAYGPLAKSRQAAGKTAIKTAVGISGRWTGGELIVATAHRPPPTAHCPLHSARSPPPPFTSTTHGLPLLAQAEGTVTVVSLPLDLPPIDAPEELRRLLAPYTRRRSPFPLSLLSATPPCPLICRSSVAPDLARCPRRSLASRTLEPRARREIQDSRARARVYVCLCVQTASPVSPAAASHHTPCRALPVPRRRLLGHSVMIRK
ncbi:hypothetical protein F4802DRAFT_388897 [Xylaria palmicola]|nr:hypothetical protein F4802DRAFT_388897 [Xylaria palmicola]